jgi:hypothetical protein
MSLQYVSTFGLGIALPAVCVPDPCIPEPYELRHQYNREELNGQSWANNNTLVFKHYRNRVMYLYVH